MQMGALVSSFSHQAALGSPGGPSKPEVCEGAPGSSELSLGYRYSLHTTACCPPEDQAPVPESWTELWSKTL